MKESLPHRNFTRNRWANLCKALRKGPGKQQTLRNEITTLPITVRGKYHLRQVSQCLLWKFLYSQSPGPEAKESDKQASGPLRKAKNKPAHLRPHTSLMLLSKPAIKNSPLSWQNSYKKKGQTTIHENMRGRRGRSTSKGILGVPVRVLTCNGRNLLCLT